MPDERAKRDAPRTIRAVIDRIEEEMAVLSVGDEAEHSIDVPAALLPAGASDGDHLQIRITLDEEARASAEQRIKEMQERLSKRGGAEGKKNFKL